MPSNARHLFSGLVRRRSGLCALFLILTVSRPSRAQSAEDKTQAEPAHDTNPPQAAPDSSAQPANANAPSPSLAPLPSTYPPPGYYAPPDYAPPPGYYAPSPYPPALYGPTPNTPTVVEGPPPSRPKTPRPYSLGATLATTSEHETGSTSVVLSPLFEGAYVVHPSFVLDLTWGFGWLVDSQGLGESTARVGNPIVSGFFRTHANAWQLRLGVGITAPLANLPLGMDGRLYAFVYNQTMAMWGMWNAWLWMPGRMATPATGRADYTFAPGQVWVAEVAVAPVIGVRGGASGTEWLGQVAVEARLSIGASFALCPRLQTVLLPSTSVDRLQSAAGLRGILKTRHGNYFAGLLINLDEPLGIWGGLRRWGFHLGKEIDL
jgi:hypothetical protein